MSPATTKHGPHGETLYSNLFVDTDVRQALVDLATQTGIVIACDETVQGLISLELKDVSVETALDLMLMPGGFVWDKVREGVYLVAKPDPKSPAFTRMAKVRVVELKYLSAKSLDGLLPPLYQPLVHSDEGGSRAVITAPGRMLDDIAAFIAELDVPGKPPPAPAPSGPQAVRLVPLKYLTVAQAQALMPAQFRASVTGEPDGDRATVVAPDKQAEEIASYLKLLDMGTDQVSVLPLLHTTGKELRAMLPESLKPFVSAADEGTNAVVSAPPRKLDEVLAAVRNIDGQVTLRDKPAAVMQTVHLNHIDAAQLLKLLPKSYLAYVQADDTSRPADSKPATTVTPEALRPSEQPRAPDLGRVVLVLGPADAVKDVLVAIAAVDKAPVQIMMEALVVEASKSDLDQFELRSQGKWWGGDSSTGTLSYGNAATNILHQVLWLVSKQQGKIKASPRVIAQDGKEANVKVTVNEYFSIVSGPVNSPYVTLQSIDATIGLTMTPRVALDDKSVTCTLLPEVDDVTGQGANALPIITRRSASTTVRVADGQVIAIGGLLQEVTSQIRRKIPLLGDIPLLGQLFRSNKTESSQREITIFVVPHVLDAQGNFEGPLLFERYTAKEKADADAAAAKAREAKAAIAPATTPTSAPNGIARPGQAPGR